MGIYATDLRELVIRPTLCHLGEWSPSAENLLLGTAAQESQLGFRLREDKCEGYGLFNISAQNHTQIWDMFLVTDAELASKLRGLASQQQFLKTPHAELITNLSYAAGVAWMIYKQHQLHLNHDLSPDDMAKIWFHYYHHRNHPNHQHPMDNSAIESFVSNYRKWVLRENKKLAA